MSDVSPKFSKGKGKSQTPQSEKVSGVTPKSQATTAKMQREQTTTPQSRSSEKQKVGKKSGTPTSNETVTTPLSQKSPKNMQQPQTSAGSAQKTTTPIRLKAGTPASNKKRKLEADNDSSSDDYDSAEEDFEVSCKCLLLCFVHIRHYLLMLYPGP